MIKQQMAMEGEELTALTVEQKSEGAQHRERVVTRLAQENKSGRMHFLWHVLVTLITNIGVTLTSLILAILTEDTMCIITATMAGVVVFLCLLAVFFPPRFEDAATFNNPEAVCLFHSRVSSDDPAFKRYCDHELPQMLASNTTPYPYVILFYFFGFGMVAVLGVVVAVGVFFIVRISEIETLLCSLGLLAQLGICILLILWWWVQLLKEVRKEPNHEDLFNTECSLFGDGILVVGKKKCIRLDKAEGTKVEWSENQDVVLLKVANTSIVLSSEVKEKQWWKALVRLRRELTDIV